MTTVLYLIAALLGPAHAFVSPPNCVLMHQTPCSRFVTLAACELIRDQHPGSRCEPEE